MTVQLAQAVLDFWFVEHGPDDWFSKNESFDETIRQRFITLYETLADAGPGDWLQGPQTSLAAVLVLDQFPRNLFRGLPQAFATDDAALQVSRHALAQGYNDNLSLHERVFLYLPFEHSENLVDQEQSCRLFETLGDDHFLDYAVRHYEVIRRFGRFPHRNAILGRISTVAELDYLNQPDSGF